MATVQSETGVEGGGGEGSWWGLGSSFWVGALEQNRVKPASAASQGPKGLGADVWFCRADELSC